MQLQHFHLALGVIAASSVAHGLALFCAMPCSALYCSYSSLDKPGSLKVPIIFLFQKWHLGYFVAIKPCWWPMEEAGIYKIHTLCFHSSATWVQNCFLLANCIYNAEQKYISEFQYIVCVKKMKMWTFS